MIKKFFALMIALLMLIPAAFAEETNPFTIYPPQKAHAIFEFESNETTGFSWTAFLLNEGVVELTKPEGEYIPEVSDKDPDTLGAGGMHRFEITAVAPGETIVLFHYSRGWESDDMITKAYWVCVTEDGNMEIRDLEGYAPLIGIVSSTDTEEGTALIETETHGEVLARFPENMPLPTVNEQVKIWFNGVMTMSLPGQINVIGWETIAPIQARTI